MRRKGGRGFTLIELIMVIVVLAVLGAIAVPIYVDLRKDAISAAVKGAANAIRSALSISIAENAAGGGLGDCPGVLDGTLFRDGSVPANPLNGFNDVKATAGDCSTGNTDLDGATGWLYNSSTCRVCPNVLGTDPVTSKAWVAL